MKGQGVKYNLGNSLYIVVKCNFSQPMGYIYMGWDLNMSWEEVSWDCVIKYFFFFFKLKQHSSLVNMTKGPLVT